MRRLWISIKIKWISILMIDIMVIMGIVAYVQLSETTKVVSNYAKSELNIKTVSTAQKLNSFFESRKTVIDTMSYNVSPKSGVIDTIYLNQTKDYLINLYTNTASNYQILNAYIGYPDDSAIIGNGWVPDEGWLATQRDWYQKGMGANGRIALTDIYIDADTKLPIVSMVKQISSSDGKLVGVAALDISLENLINIIYQERLGKSSIYLLMDESGNIIYDTSNTIDVNTAEVQNIETTLDGKLKEVSGKLKTATGETSHIKFNDEDMVFVSSRISGTNLILVGGIAESEFKSTLNKIRAVNLGGLLGAEIVLFLAAFILFTITVKSIKRISVSYTHLRQRRWHRR